MLLAGLAQPCGRTKPAGNRCGSLGFDGTAAGGRGDQHGRENTETDVAYIGEGETLQQAGHRMNQLGVAALPVCGEDGKFQGIITRGVVVEAIAAGGGPQTVTVGEVASRCWSLRARSVSSCQYSTPGRGATDASCRSPAIT